MNITKEFINFVIYLYKNLLYNEQNSLTKNLVVITLLTTHLTTSQKSRASEYDDILMNKIQTQKVNAMKMLKSSNTVIRFPEIRKVTIQVFVFYPIHFIEFSAMIYYTYF